MNVSVEHRLLMGHMDVEKILERKRQLRIRKAMSNYQLAVHNKQDFARDTFLDEVLEIEREFQEELSEYDKMFDYALYFEREKRRTTNDLQHCSVRRRICQGSCSWC